jgi:hypothetical protein
MILGNTAQVKTVEVGGDHLLVVMQSTVNQDKWLTGHSDDGKQAPTAALEFDGVTKKSYLLPMTDMVGKERQALLQPYSQELALPSLSKIFQRRKIVLVTDSNFLDVHY